MNDVNSQGRRTKVVYPPDPTDSSLLTSIYSIEIEENEEVEWQWLELPDGNKVVTNYKIISQPEKN
ncbi:MAG: hypothetical protein QNJ63_27175 [Calothrix sp. MO_192.B10]|nr:hypothetical protein [Calothrix sp. MO_192.B10]